MSKSACRQFFDENSDNLKKVELLILEEGRFDWEKQSASEYSPCIVGSEELCRQIQQPLYYNLEKGALTPDAFNDAFDKGLSTDRLGLTTVADVISRASERDAQYAKRAPDKTPRTTVALAYFNVDDIRAFRSENNQQGLAVFDTATSDNRAHADVCAMAGGKQERRRVRAHFDNIHRLEKIADKDQLPGSSDLNGTDE